MEEDQERLLHSRSPEARKSALFASDWRLFAFIGGSLSPFRINSRSFVFIGGSLRRSDSLRFVFTELLEARIVPERIEHGIEPEQRGSERHAASRQCTFVRCRE